MIVSLGLLGLALKALPVGTAYAVWTGIGTSAPRCSASGCLASRRRRSGWAAIALIVCGIMGLKLAA